MMLFLRALDGTPLTTKTAIIKLYIIYIYWSCTMARRLQKIHQLLQDR